MGPGHRCHTASLRKQKMTNSAQDPVQRRPYDSIGKQIMRMGSTFIEFRSKAHAAGFQSQRKNAQRKAGAKHDDR